MRLGGNGIYAVSMSKRNGRPAGQLPAPEVLDKEAQVVSLRRQGMTWQEIASAVGYASPSGASDAYARASRRVVAEDVESLRLLESERLDYLHASHWEKALEGDIKSTEIILKVMDRRSRLLGLDAPARKQVEQANTFPEPFEIDAQVDRLIRLAQAYPDFE
jgi:hypothetical protein